MQNENELSATLEKQSLPTEFPLTGSASMEEVTEGEPMCIFHASVGTTVVAAASGTVMAVNDDGEEYLLALTHLSGRLHLDDTLVLRGEQSHQRGLDDRYQCHIGIGAHGDGSHEVRTEFARQEDGCRAVGSSDDGDACCLVGLEA